MSAPYIMKVDHESDRFSAMKPREWRTLVNSPGLARAGNETTQPWLYGKSRYRIALETPVEMTKEKVKELMKGLVLPEGVRLKLIKEKDENGRFYMKIKTEDETRRTDILTYVLYPHSYNEFSQEFLKGFMNPRYGASPSYTGLPIPKEEDVPSEEGYLRV